MARGKSEPAPKRKPGRPPTGRGVLLGVRCQPALLAELDSWRTAQPVPPTRPQALLYLAQQGLATTKSPKKTR